jgi:cytochrome b561
MLKNTENTYGVVAKVFHWLLFLMLSFTIVAGNFLASMHKSFGAVLMMLIMLRLLWRLINMTPKLPDETTAVESLLAKGMHWALYALMLAQPLSGMLMSQAAGHPVSFFGLFEFPVFIEQAKDSAEFFRAMHGAVWILLVVAVLGHIGAALNHHFIKKDNVMKQMTIGA